mgnify:CR=1 FL=1
MQGPRPATGILQGTTHLFALRVYYEDTDLSGIAYHAKPKTAAAAAARIEHGDLTALLYAQGIRQAEWVQA